ncbi:MAG: hypothetical protein AAF570_21480, partial [Bacteroidota bacterium]
QQLQNGMESALDISAGEASPMMMKKAPDFALDAGPIQCNGGTTAKGAGLGKALLNLWEYLAPHRKGAETYLKIGGKDEGSEYARALMWHYATGFGGEFNPEEGVAGGGAPTAKMWSTFMAGRPEIQEYSDAKFHDLTLGFAKKGNTKSPQKFKSQLDHGIALNELESMQFTLHGAHKVTIEGEYEVRDHPKGGKLVILRNMRFEWIDAGDMHPGTKSKTDEGEEVDDKEYVGAGSGFPIRIPFYIPGETHYQVVKNWPNRVKGWPYDLSAESKIYRGPNKNADRPIDVGVGGDVGFQF